MFCRYCGQKNADESLPCTCCGKKLREPAVAIAPGAGIDRDVVGAAILSVVLPMFGFVAAMWLFAEKKPNGALLSALISILVGTAWCFALFIR